MEKCIEFYDELVDMLNDLVSIDVKKLNLTLPLEQRLNNFYTSLLNEDTFTLFGQTKIKAFSAKTVETHSLSSSLFEECTLKTIFNNQPDEVKSQLWQALYHLYIELERLNKQHPDRVPYLKEQIKRLRQAPPKMEFKSDMLKKIIKTDVNETTTNMLDDIMGSFNSVLTNKGNPFENIMNIGNMISSKYSDKIQNGEIELDKILGGMENVMGGGGMMEGLKNMMGGEGGLNLDSMMGNKTEEPVIIDENFSTSNIDIGKEEESNGFNLGALGKLKPLADMVSKLGNMENEDDVESLKNEMDGFMQNELKVDMSKFKEQMEDMQKKIMENIDDSNINGTNDE